VLPPARCACRGNMASLATDTCITVKLKWGKQAWKDFIIEPSKGVAGLKGRIFSVTNVLPERQKIMCKGAWKGVLSDTADLSRVKFKPRKSQLVMMGSAETVVAPPVGQGEMNVINDMDMNELELDFEDGNIMEKLQKSIAKTPISSRMMNEPRPGFPLLVLDLDHTLLHFSTKDNVEFSNMKRPYMQEFLVAVYKYFDIVIWSQTSWRWLEIKLIELGFLEPTNSYKILFVLDKECMFRRKSRTMRTKEGKKKRKGKAFKPLELIWSKFPQWSKQNTLHIDDVEANFGLNPKNGVKCRCWRSGENDDIELLQIANYLRIIAVKKVDMSTYDHSKWFEVMNEELAKEKEAKLKKTEQD
jgi:ubiquitin-like domain-containing CTD phosphatase 1